MSYALYIKAVEVLLCKLYTRYRNILHCRFTAWPAQTTMLLSTTSNPDNEQLKLLLGMIHRNVGFTESELEIW